MTVVIFLYLATANLVVSGWHLREFWRHAANKRLKVAQLVLFTGPLGWVIFVGREFHYISVEVASIAVAFAIFTTSLHVVAVWSQVSQRTDL